MPAVYYRLSRAYHFLRGQAEQNKSPETEIQGRRITDVLEELERTALALTALSLLELGIPPDGLLTTPLPQGFPQSLQSTAERWLRALPDDPALALDKRFAADLNSGRKWANVGVRLQRLRYTYEHPPTVNGRAAIGKPVSYYAPVSVFAEFARPITEGPFGEFCDRHKTISGCLSALGARKGEAEGRYISIQTLLGFLAACVALDVALFILGLRRRRLALAHSAVWWAAALVVTLLAATSLGRTVVLLNLAPRFALPRAPLAWITYGHLYQWEHPNGYRKKSEKALRLRAAVGDWLLSHALLSNSKPIRANALNLCHPDDNLGDRRTRDALLRICETRDFDEVDLALIWVGGTTDVGFRGIYQHHPEAAPEDLPRLLAILRRFANSPSLVLKCAPAFWATRDRSLLPLLDEALRNGFTTDPYRAAGIYAAMMLQPEKLPYDVLVEIEERRPLKSQDGLEQEPAGIHPLPDVGAMEALARRYRDIREAAEYWKRGPEFTPRREPLDLVGVERALADLRIVDLLVRVVKEEQDYFTFYTIFYQRLPEYMGPQQRKVWFDKIASWLIEDPPTAQPSRYKTVLYSLIGGWNPGDGTKLVDHRDALKRVYESGRWNRELTSADSKETYGGRLENALRSLDSTDDK